MGVAGQEKGGTSVRGQGRADALTRWDREDVRKVVRAELKLAKLNDAVPAPAAAAPSSAGNKAGPGGRGHGGSGTVLHEEDKSDSRAGAGQGRARGSQTGGGHGHKGPHRGGGLPQSSWGTHRSEGRRPRVGWARGEGEKPLGPCHPISRCRAVAVEGRIISPRVFGGRGRSQEWSG
ncbi:unnamed protein product, partial [Discosporangium mesarthrocarpum]